MPASGKESLCALHESTSQPATWFEFVEDNELIAFKQPLLAALSQPVAVGELVGGARDGTLVVIPTGAPGHAGEERITAGDPVNAFALE